MDKPQFTEIELSKMRAILADHDAGAPIKVIDLNKPEPIPYRFQKFPMMVYDHAGSAPAREDRVPRQLASGGVVMETVHVPAKIASRIVRSENELHQAIGQGWLEEAPHFTETMLVVQQANYLANELGATGSIAYESPLDRMTKAELVALAREMGIKIDPADKKEVILAALKAPDEVAA